MQKFGPWVTILVPLRSHTPRAYFTLKKMPKWAATSLPLRRAGREVSSTFGKEALPKWTFGPGEVATEVERADFPKWIRNVTF